MADLDSHDSGCVLDFEVSAQRAAVEVVASRSAREVGIQAEEDLEEEEEAAAVAALAVVHPAAALFDFRQILAAPVFGPSYTFGRS